MMLFDRILTIDADDEQDVADYLSSEWEAERVEYPYAAPPFDAAAAVWAARTVYRSAQLLLYRQHTNDDIHALLPEYNKPADAGAMLSADLCLRLLPCILTQLRLINPDDPVIPVLESHLKIWHYSAIGHNIAMQDPDFALLSESRCAMQLYADRVIMRKDEAAAAKPDLAPVIAASLGNFRQYFWKQ